MKLQAIAPNQTVLNLATGTQVFFSYNTPVAAFVPGKGYLRTTWRYSNTTNKHINKWLNGFEVTYVSQEEIEELAI